MMFAQCGAHEKARRKDGLKFSILGLLICDGTDGRSPSRCPVETNGNLGLATTIGSEFDRRIFTVRFASRYRPTSAAVVVWRVGDAVAEQIDPTLAVAEDLQTEVAQIAAAAEELAASTSASQN
jgi:hypothetical protein